jgi:hypothetical protein
VRQHSRGRRLKEGEGGGGRAACAQHQSSKAGRPGSAPSPPSFPTPPPPCGSAASVNLRPLRMCTALPPPAACINAAPGGIRQPGLAIAGRERTAPTNWKFFIALQRSPSGARRSAPHTRRIVALFVGAAFSLYALLAVPLTSKKGGRQALPARTATWPTLRAPGFGVEGLCKASTAPLAEPAARFQQPVANSGPSGACAQPGSFRTVRRPFERQLSPANVSGACGALLAPPCC